MATQAKAHDDGAHHVRVDESAWMWEDAGWSPWTRRNPLRWSRWQTIDDSIADFQPLGDAEKQRPVRMKFKNSEETANYTRVFETVVIALDHLGGIKRRNQKEGAGPKNHPALGRRLSQQDLGGGSPTQQALPRRTMMQAVEEEPGRRQRASVVTMKREPGETVRLKVLSPNGQIARFEFTRGSLLEEQLTEMCQQHAQLGINPDDTDVVLTACEGVSDHIFGSVMEVLLLENLAEVKLEKTDALVDRLVSAVHDAESSNVALELRRLLPAIMSDAIDLDVLLEQGCFETVLELFEREDINSHGHELAQACLFELIQFEEALDKLHKAWPDNGDQILRRMLTELFPSEDDVDRMPPRATLGLLLFLLEKVPGACLGVHRMAMRQSFYGTILVAVADEDRANRDRFTSFQNIAAKLVLAMLFEEARRLKEAGETKMEEEMLGALASAENEMLDSEVDNGNIRSVLEGINFRDELLYGLENACVAVVSGMRAADSEELQQEIKELRKELEKEQQYSDALKHKLRQSKEAMKCLRPFVQIRSSAVVQDAVQKVMEEGWDSQSWESNYTTLHYACEFVPDAPAVKLVAAFCADIESQDDLGYQAVDYAGKNPDKQVAELMVDLVHKQHELRGVIQASLSVMLKVRRFGKAWLHKARENLAKEAGRSLSSPAFDKVISQTTMKDELDKVKDRLRHQDRQSNKLTALTEVEEKAEETPENKLKSGALGANMLKVRVQLLAQRLDKSEKEKHELQKELEMKGASLGGLLEKDRLVKFGESLADGDVNAVVGEMKKMVKDGGMGLSADTSKEAVKQLEQVMALGSGGPPLARLKTYGARGPDGKLLAIDDFLDGGDLGQPGAAAAAGGKGKGPAPAGGKGPAPPGGKGPAPPGDAATKGSDKGGKGPAAPAGKGPAPPGGKGPAPPGGKGPAPPGGKGPPAPGGKGPPAPGGKGPPGKGPPAGDKGGKGKKGKGKEEVLVVRTKKEAKPKVDMKPLHWKRFCFKENGPLLDPERKTIWHKCTDDHALVPADELEKRFAAKPPPKKAAGGGGGEVKEKAAPTKLRIPILSPEARGEAEKFLGLSLEKTMAPRFRDAIANQLPSQHQTDPAKTAAVKAKIVVTAILKMDEKVLPVELLEGIVKHLSLEAKEVLEAMREAQVGLPWDTVEAYLWELKDVAALSERLECWRFIRELEGEFSMLEDPVQKFAKLVGCFSQSKELPRLLSMTLACGNFLNGDGPSQFQASKKPNQRSQYQRGQADGFHLDLLGDAGTGLDGLNDGEGWNIRRPILRAYIEQDPKGAAALLDELAPLFSNIKRTLAKDPDGAMVLNKSVRVQIESLKKEVDKLKGAFNVSQKIMTTALQKIKDDEDRFKVQARKLYEAEKGRLERLVKHTEDAEAKFADMLKLFCAEDPKLRMVEAERKSKDASGQMKVERVKVEMDSNSWCLLWDDFFIPKPTLYRTIEDEKKRKAQKEDECFPRLSRTAPDGGPANIDLEGLQMLWGLQDVDLPGPYKVLLDGVSLEAPAKAALPRGEVVKVLEVVRKKGGVGGGDQIRGRVEDPAGWVVLLDVATGRRTAERRWGKPPAAKKLETGSVKDAKKTETGSIKRAPKRKAAPSTKRAGPTGPASDSKESAGAKGFARVRVHAQLLKGLTRTGGDLTRSGDLAAAVKTSTTKTGAA